MSKTAQTLVCLLLLAAVPYFVPGLGRYRVLGPATAPSPEAPATPRAPAVEPADEGQAQARPAHEPKPGEIEDASGHALDHFFSALREAEIGGGQARVCHYGDSPITNDGITSTVRRRLQQRFGDAGRGFTLVARPWGWYEHDGVALESGPGWKSDPMFISRGDLRYGLGGVSFTAAAGATASIGTVEGGGSVSAFEIHYLARPGGGEFEVEIDGRPTARVSTAGDDVRSGFARVPVDPGAHRLTIKVVGAGEVRLFGVTLENGSRGVQYDSLGVNGAFVGLLARYLDADHWAEQLRHRRPDLVIINYGANESQYENWPMDQYEAETREVVRRIRAALPEVSILFVAPMDRGQRGAGGKIVTRRTIPRLVAAQRRIAAETGCAFFDTFTAMGGEGTVARWFEARPRLMGGDFTHPTARGAEIVGTLIYDAIITAYEIKNGPRMTRKQTD